MWVYGIGISIWKKFPHSPTFKFNGTVHFNILLCRREPNIKCKHMIGFKYCCLQIGYRFRDNMLNVKKMQIDRSGRLQLQMCVTWYTIHKYILYLCIWTKYSPFENKKCRQWQTLCGYIFPRKQIVLPASTFLVSDLNRKCILLFLCALILKLYARKWSDIHIYALNYL